MNLKNMRFDNSTGEFIREERITINASADIKDIEDAINIELAQIVRQVRALKLRAEELKAMKAILVKRAGSTDPAPVSEETQLTPAENLDSK